MRHDILVVGGGSIGERHLRCFLRTGRATVSLCEIHEEVRARLASDYPVRRSFSAFDEALTASPGPVVIATPAHLHVPMALAAGRAGSPVLIEKPLSTKLDGIEPLDAMAAASNRVIRVAYVLRHHPALAAVKDGLEAGTWGKPLHLTVVSGQHFPTFRPAYREIYYAAHETGGGALQDGLTHHLDAGQWWLGPIGRLVGDAGHLGLPGVEVEDTANVLARHGEVMAAYHFNQHQFPNETVYTLCCERATVRAELTTNRLFVMNEPTGRWDRQSGPALERDDLFVSQAHAFLDAVEGRDSFACTVPEAIHTLRCQLALLHDFQRNDHPGWRTPNHA